MRLPALAASLAVLAACATPVTPEAPALEAAVPAPVIAAPKQAGDA